jgi:hypothetical protein
MFRLVLWALLAAYLIVIGLFPDAAAPIGLAFTGAGVILGAIPGPVLLLATVVAWLKHRPTPTA